MGNIQLGLLELPLRRAIQVMRNKAEDVAKQLTMPSFFDQYPGKPVPWSFSKTYTIDGIVDPTDTSTLNLSAFLLPDNGNIITGRDASFFWCETNAFAFAQRNVGIPNAGLFDATLRGGGAVNVQNVQGPLAINNVDDDFSFVAFEVDLYDARRGRSITNGRIPGQTFATGSTGFRRWKHPARFDPDTVIEPRVYVTQTSSPAALETGNERFFLNLTFKGFMILQEVTGRETMLDGEDDGVTP